MRLSLKRSVLVIAATFLASPAAASWPNGAKAAVVLTYDDAAPSQLDHAVPVLDKAGLKGSFFLSNVRIEDVERWRKVGASGHELANHTLFHPCLSGTFDMPRQQQLEQHTPQSVLREIAQQNVLLKALDGHDHHGFAVPCGQTLAGGVDYLPVLKSAGLVTYSRTAEESEADLSRKAADFDAFNLPGRGFATPDGADKMIAFAQQAVNGGGMAVYVFHGVGGDHLSVTAEDHARLVEWLAAHRSTVWVATMQQAVDWIQAGKTKSAP